MTVRSTVVGAWAPLLFVLLWSTGPIATKVGVRDVAPLDLLAWRFLLLAGVMGCVAAITGRVRRLNRADILHCAVAGILIQAIYLGTAFVALGQGMSAGLSAMITGLQPIVAAALGVVVLGELLSRMQIAGAFLAGVGLLVYAGDQITFDAVPASAVLLHLVGVISIGSGVVYQRRFCSHVGLLDNIAVQYLAGAFPVMLLAWAVPGAESTWSPQAIAALAWLVIMLSLGATTLLVFLLKRDAAANTAALFFLMPPTTALMAAAYPGEALVLTTVISVIMTAAGVALVMRCRPPAPKRS